MHDESGNPRRDPDALAFYGQFPDQDGYLSAADLIEVPAHAQERQNRLHGG